MPRQYDVVANPDPSDAALRPYLVILQSDRISVLNSAVVAPLIVRTSMSGAHRLNPSIVVGERDYWLATHELFAIDRRVLGRTIANIDGHREAIAAALDLVFFGV